MTMNPLNDYFLQIEMDDISTASSAFVVAPDAGKIIKVQTILHGAITVADAALTLEINGVAVTGAAITVATAGSAAGTVDSSNPTAANQVQEGDAIELISDGGSTTARRLTAVLTIRR